MTTRLMVSPPIGTEAMMRQWERFVEILTCAGDVEVVRSEPKLASPNLTFTASAGVVCGKLAVLSTLDRSEPNAGRCHRVTLVEKGFATISLSQTSFAGARDALFDRGRPILYVGYGARTDREAAAQLAETLGVTTIPLLLVDPRFTHLDMALCPLPGGHVMAHLDAFSQYGQRVLRRTIGPDYLIEVSLEDAMMLACNAVELGDTIVVHNLSPRLRARLIDAGYRLYSTDLDEFVAAGGSAKSLTLKLEDGPVFTEAAA
jgi:N-dimethylarginine dimethylaminohydrolase